MKEYIFNALDENGWVAERIWDGYITFGIWSPLFIAAVIMLIIKYRKSKDYVNRFNVCYILTSGARSWIYYISIIFILVYSIFLIVNLLILGNSIILYEIKH